MKIHIHKKENKLQQANVSEKESVLYENSTLTTSTNAIIAMIFVFFHHIDLWQLSLKQTISDSIQVSIYLEQRASLIECKCLLTESIRPVHQDVYTLSSFQHSLNIVRHDILYLINFTLHLL